LADIAAGHLAGDLSPARHSGLLDQQRKDVIFLRAEPGVAAASLGGGFGH
jgi:hypothetical protein